MPMLPDGIALAGIPGVPGLTVKLTCGHAAHISLNNKPFFDDFPNGWAWCSVCDDDAHVDPCVPAMVAAKFPDLADVAA